jgi:hypothetical protein
MKHCVDCVNWNPDSEETGYCDKPESGDRFQLLIRSLVAKGQVTKIDAQECDGFEDCGDD